MAVNGDEGEPETFKDRLYLSGDPHRMIEGILIAAHVVGVDAYIYMRDEYPEIIALLRRGALVKGSGSGGSCSCICGAAPVLISVASESAMIEIHRGQARPAATRPPYVAEKGIFDRPTLVNNVETLHWVRDIIEKGADWFNAQGKDGHPGPAQLFGVRSRGQSGRNSCAPPDRLSGTSSSCAAAMADGHDFKGYLRLAAHQAGILPADQDNIPLDFGGPLADEGCFVGSHAVVVLSDRDNMWDVATDLMQFFAHESCGQCTPCCRNGTAQAVMLMQAEAPDTGLLDELSMAMADASICGLGQAASNPLTSVMKHFPEDIGGTE